MSILPDFELPSDPSVIVRLREATVSDAIDFSEVNPNSEEEATSLFLERIQAKEKYSDPRRWTVEDRRYALFMYHLQTAKFPDIPLTYTCDACSAAEDREVQHTVAVKYSDILDEYTPMDGKPVRDVVHEGRAVLVHPIYGTDAEKLEMMRVALMLEEETTGKPARRLQSQLRIANFIACIDIPGLAPDATEEARRPEVEKFVYGMGTGEFVAFREKVVKQFEGLRHGLRTVFVDGRVLLETPPVFCPEGRDAGGAGTRLRFPFRAFDYIPYI